MDKFTHYTNFNQEEKQSSERVLAIKGKLILRKAVAYQKQGLLDEAR